MHSKELLCRQKALAALNQVLHKRENIATALREGYNYQSRVVRPNMTRMVYLWQYKRPCCTFTGVAVSLKGLLSDDDNYVRCLTAQALTILAGKEILLVLFSSY